MSTPQSYESQLLEPAEQWLAEWLGDHEPANPEMRMQLLESAASCLGQFSLQEYFTVFTVAPLRDYTELEPAGRRLVELLKSIPIHPALALSSLAREPLSASDRRATGAYYTDFRLANHLAELGVSTLHTGAKILDPASGTGILLVAVTIQVCGSDRSKSAEWLAGSVYAADLSAQALRGARLALASLTDDVQAIQKMWSHWRVQDSLLAAADSWLALAPEKFDLVIGNPPWEKVKLTRHEYLISAGAMRHYGEEYEPLDETDYHEKKTEVATYAQLLRQRYPHLHSGESDLYMAFVQLFAQLVRPRGQVVILIPAGLIRSQGTESLRRMIVNSGQDIAITVLENRARFFAIDARFKFITLRYMRHPLQPNGQRKDNNGSISGTIRLFHAMGTPQGVQITSKARLGLETLSNIRPDLTIPEVRSNEEWRIFVSMIRNGIDWSKPDSPWFPAIMREVDMTRSRGSFTQKPTSSSLPVIEGRMIQAHRFGAKRYVSGSGRRAVWAPVPEGESVVQPQFWMDPNDLSPKVWERSNQLRAGFCDIAAQTNERSMTAALVPPGVVCGNKVPTIVFPNDLSEERLLLWTGIVNSLPFDWMLRRVLTTTVNYFLLRSLPLPPIEPTDREGQCIIRAARRLREMDRSFHNRDPWENAWLRAMIDLEVLSAYGLSYEQLVRMLADFPLLDRGQPPLPGEDASTITRDYLLACAAEHFSLSPGLEAVRVEAARTIGAVPYVPSEMAAIAWERNRYFGISR